ncbi:MAG: TolC family protein [Acidobacteria bacterium]|nr:TolC family protein [Acidobacteriota bacterium]
MKQILFMGVVMLWVSVASAQQSTNSQALPERLTMQQAMDLMLKQNLLLLRDQQSPRIAKSDVVQAGLRPNPNFEIASESYPLFESSPGPFFNNQELVVRAGQTIETAGKRGKRIRVAKQELAATESGLQDTVRQLKLELKRRYYVVVLAKAQRDLAGEILKQFDDIIRLNEARYKQGELSGLEINRIRAERLRFYNDLLDAELQLKNAKTDLLEVLGVSDLNTTFDVTEALAAQPFTADPLQLQTQAIESRPDLRAERQRLERDRQDLQLQKAERIPNVTPFFGYKRDFGANTAAFGLSIPLPLFNRNQGGIERASAQIQQRQYETSRLSLSVRRDVQAAYQTAQTQSERVRALEQQYVPSARSTREIAQQSYRLGALDLIGFLDAERIYRETLRSYNLALFDYQTSIFQLEAAVGKEF